MLGPEGVQEVLEVLAEEEEREVATVAIGEMTPLPERLRADNPAGGIHLPNLPHLLHGSASPRKRLDGIALISDIVASMEPEKAAQALRQVLDASKREEVTNSVFGGGERSSESLVKQAIELLRVVRERTPLAHQVRSNLHAFDLG